MFTAHIVDGSERNTCFRFAERQTSMEKTHDQNTVLSILLRKAQSGEMTDNDFKDYLSCLAKLIDADMINCTQEHRLISFSTGRLIFERCKHKINVDLVFDWVAEIARRTMRMIQMSQDKFMVYAAQKLLVAIMNALSSQVMVEDTVRDLMEILKSNETKTFNKTAFIDILTSLLTSEYKNILMKLMFEIFPWISKELIKNPTSIDDKLLLLSILSLFEKYMKTAHELGEQDYTLGVCEPLLHHIHTQTDNLIFRRVLQVLNAAYPYSHLLSSNSTLHHHHYQFGEQFLQWICDKDICEFPLFYHCGFGGEHVDTPSDNDLKRSEFSSGNVFSSLAMLIFKISALLLQEVTTDCSRVFKCLQQLTNIAEKDRNECYLKDDWATKTECYRDFDWIICVFGDQDDALIETMLALLNIHLVYKKSLSTEAACSHIDVPKIYPQRQFYQFLSMTGFDQSILVDLLTSPETCFLLYLTRYLKYIISDWLEFCEVHKQLSVDLIAEKSTKGYRETAETQSLGQDMALDDHAHSAVYEKGSDDMTPSSELLNSSKISEFVVDDSSSEMTTVSTTDSNNYSEAHTDSVTDNDIASNIEKSTENSRTCKSSDITKDSSVTIKDTREQAQGSYSVGLSLLGLYDDDEEEEENNYIDDDIGEVQRKREYQTVSPCSKAFIESSCDNNPCLDQTLSTLIRLRLKVENLYDAGLFSYNPRPLINLIQKCEYLYENKVPD